MPDDLKDAKRPLDFEVVSARPMRVRFRGSDGAEREVFITATVTEVLEAHPSAGKPEGEQFAFSLNWNTKVFAVATKLALVLAAMMLSSMAWALPDGMGSNGGTFTLSAGAASTYRPLTTTFDNGATNTVWGNTSVLTQPSSFTIGRSGAHVEILGDATLNGSPIASGAWVSYGICYIIFGGIITAVTCGLGFFLFMNSYVKRRLDWLAKQRAPLEGPFRSGGRA